MAKSRNRRVQDDTADDAAGVLVGELVDGFDDADDKAVAAAVLVEELVDAFDVDTVVAAADDGVADSGEEPVVGVEICRSKRLLLLLLYPLLYGWALSMMRWFSFSYSLPSPLTLSIFFCSLR